MNLDYFDKIWLSHEKAGMKNADKMWDARASEFNKMGKDERVDIIMGLLQEKDMLNHNSTVLDVGCGPGKFVLEFAKKARHVVGVDISPKMLEYAKENPTMKRKNVIHKLRTSIIDMSNIPHSQIILFQKVFFDITVLFS
jgi:cyclopropane fatty-acyl-phospholipid synthase-like methyltransferase